MTAPANPVTNTWGSSAAGRTRASWRWYQWWWARACHSVPSTAPAVAPLTRTRYSPTSGSLKRADPKASRRNGTSSLPPSSIGPGQPQGGHVAEVRGR